MRLVPEELNIDPVGDLSDDDIPASDSLTQSTTVEQAPAELNMQVDISFPEQVSQG